MSEAEVERLDGAIGFFDISGFTKLSNALQTDQTDAAAKLTKSTRGRRSSFGRIGDLNAQSGHNFATAARAGAGVSAEQLTDQINPIFLAVVEVIERYGGDIVKFVGDAMIVLWPARSLGNRRPSATVEGSTSGEVLSDLDRAVLASASCALAAVDAMRGLNEKLGIHIGLGCGSVAHVVCGGRGRYYQGVEIFARGSSLG